MLDKVNYMTPLKNTKAKKKKNGGVCERSLALYW